MGNLTDAEIPLLSLEKQREIVEKLDTAFTEIDSLEINLGLGDEKANQLSQSLLSAALTSSGDSAETSNFSANQGVAIKLVRIGDVCIFNPPKIEAREALNSDDLVGFLPMQDLGIESMYAEARTSKPLNEVIKAYTYFAENDVLVAKITPCFENGKMGIARNLINGTGFGSSEYFVLRPTNNIMSEYLYYFLRQEFVIENGRGIMTGAVGHRRVPGDYLENLEIPLPSLKKQQEIVSKLDSHFAEMEILKAQVSIKKDYAVALRQSLLSSAFTQVEVVA
jgi:type I restriction enzyme S subunit